MTRVSLFDRRVLALALPAVGTAMVPLVHRAVDMAFCRELGEEAIAALSVASVAVWIYYSFGMLVGVGLTAVVARYDGAGRGAGAGYAASQGVRFAALLGVLTGIVGIAAAPLLFRAAGAGPSVLEQGVPYARIYWAAGPFVLLLFAGDAIFRAHGNTRTPLRIALMTLVCNVVLDPLLIRGIGPLPAFGVAGAAWATLLASVFGAALYAHALTRSGHLTRARPDDAALRLTPHTRLGTPGFLGLDPAMAQRVFKVGIPPATAALLFNMIYLVILRLTDEAGGVDGGAAAQAGLGVGHTGEGVAYVMALGWAGAASALVGRALGAGDADLAERQAWTSFGQCAVVTGVFAVVLYVFADDIAALFVNEAAARAYGADYFRIVSWALVPQAAEIVLGGAFGGAGMTLPPMTVGITISLARIPLCYYAAFDLDMGVSGIFWVIAVTAAVRGVIIAAWFRRNVWKTQEV